MSMAPIEPRKYLANAHSAQDRDTAPPGTQFAEGPPHYKRHNNHYHLVRPGTSRTSTSEFSLRRYFSPKKSCLPKPGQTKPKRHVSFVHVSPESVVTPATEPPMVPGRKSGLKRGLQIPSRVGTITSGFKLPPLLEAQGVSKTEWRIFTKELKSYGKMDGKQKVTFVGVSIGYGVLGSFISPHFGGIPAKYMSHKWHKQTEQNNFLEADTKGEFDSFTKRWNEIYFEPLGLHVMIAIPGNGGMEDMDVASTKLFKYQQRISLTAPRVGVAPHDGRKENKYKLKEGPQRAKASQKARIIFLPFERRSEIQNDTPQDSASQKTCQTDIRDYFDGNRSGFPEKRVGTPPPDPGWIPAGRRATATATTVQPAS